MENSRAVEQVEEDAGDFLKPFLHFRVRLTLNFFRPSSLLPWILGAPQHARQLLQGGRCVAESTRRNRRNRPSRECCRLPETLLLLAGKRLVMPLTGTPTWDTSVRCSEKIPVRIRPSSLPHKSSWQRVCIEWTCASATSLDVSFLNYPTGQPRKHISFSNSKPPTVAVVPRAVPKAPAPVGATQEASSSLFISPLGWAVEDLLQFSNYEYSDKERS